jgi:hypothetical protein
LDAREIAYRQRALSITEIANEPSFASMRMESRFRDLLRRTGLENRIAK